MCLHGAPDLIEACTEDAVSTTSLNLFHTSRSCSSTLRTSKAWVLGGGIYSNWLHKSVAHVSLLIDPTCRTGQPMSLKISKISQSQSSEGRTIQISILAVRIQIFQIVLHALFLNSPIKMVEIWAMMRCVEMSWNVMKCHNVINVLETCSFGPLFCPRQTPEVITQTKRHWEVSRAGHWYSFSDAMGPTAFVEIWFCKSLLHLRFDDPVFLDHPFFAQNLRRPVFSNHYVAFPKEVQPGHSFRARRIGKHHL